jgi:hypothetical protein
MKIKNNTLVDDNNNVLYFDMEILEPWVIDDFFKHCCTTDKNIVTTIIDEAFQYWDAKKRIIAHIKKNEILDINDKNLISFNPHNILEKNEFKFKIETDYEYLFTYLMMFNIYSNASFISKYKLKLFLKENKANEFLKNNGCDILKNNNQLFDDKNETYNHE